jgi:uncharacterized low-complexity protein
MAPAALSGGRTIDLDQWPSLPHAQDSGIPSSGSGSMNRLSIGPFAIAISATVVLHAVAAQAAVFEMRDLPSGYMVSEAGGAAPGQAQQTQPPKDQSMGGHCGGQWSEGMCGAHAVSTMDADRDGRLSRDEFTSYHMKVHDGRCGSHWGEGGCGGRWARGMRGAQWNEGLCGARAFDLMDANRDGRLTTDELTSYRTKLRDGMCGEGRCGGSRRE